MRKFLVLLLGIILLAGATACFGQVFYKMAFYPQYWITGTVKDAADGTIAVGRQVVFFKGVNEYNGGIYALGVVGADNRYMLNTFGLGISSLDVGETYLVTVPNDNPSDPAEGYGADPQPVDKISGDGVDEAFELVLAKGAGPLPPPPPGTEPAPEIKIWFGERLYHSHIYGLEEEDKKLFVVEETGTIKLEIDIPAPFHLDEAASNDMWVTNPQGATTQYSISSISGSQVIVTGTRPLIRSMVIESPFPEALTAEEDKAYYTFKFQASSKGDIGMTATSVSTQAVVAVLGGPLRVIGPVLPYPAPYSPTKDKEVTIQYTLSKEGNIDIFIISIAGETVKRIFRLAGTEGGNAGVNKVTWDGKTEIGEVVGNGVYVGTIVSRDEGKLLARFKLTVLD